MRRIWLVFSQTVTVAVAVLFVVGTFKPEWLSGRAWPLPALSRPAAPAPSTTASNRAGTGGQGGWHGGR